MLQISNLDDGKSEWNMNETHIIIPMIDGDLPHKDSDKTARTALTLNAVEGDQNILTNGLEPSLGIGLDKNLFETYNSKSDLLVIQNSDLKLLSSNSDLKAPVAYTLSYIDQERNEILWGSSMTKEKTKVDWCSNDKTIFEVKDVIAYDDSVQDPSKQWHEELEKGSDQIHLDEVSSDLTSHVPKIDEGILIPVENENGESKRLLTDTSGDSHYIVNYYPTNQGSEAVSIVKNGGTVNVQKHIENANSAMSVAVENNSTVKDELVLNTNPIKKSCDSSKWEKMVNGDLLSECVSGNFKGGQVLDSGLPQQVVNEFTKSVTNTDKSASCTLYQTDVKQNLDKAVKNMRVICKTTDDYGTDITALINNIQSSLPEKSLPLKKKAKMKRTLFPAQFEITKTILKKESLMYRPCGEIQNNVKSETCFKHKPNAKNSNNSDSDERLICKVRKRKKSDENEIKKNQNKNMKTSCDHKSNQEDKITSSSLIISDESINEDTSRNAKSLRCNVFGFDRSKFNTVFELIEGLKRYRIINGSVWQTLHVGLKEMNVDVLKEMNEKLEKNISTNDISYSTHLKAFALILYFKQPAAFNHLAKLYKNGWPSLAVIKEWKRQVNNQQRPDFPGVQKEIKITKF